MSCLAPQAPCSSFPFSSLPLSQARRTFRCHHSRSQVASLFDALEDQRLEQLVESLLDRLTVELVRGREELVEGRLGGGWMCELRMSGWSVEGVAGGRWLVVRGSSWLKRPVELMGLVQREVHHVVAPTHPRRVEVLRLRVTLARNEHNGREQLDR